MVKTIEFELLENQDICIKVNSEEKLTIKNDNRSLNGKSIYDILDYSRGDTYIFNINTPEGKNLDAINVLKELFEEIVNGITSLEVQAEDQELVKNVNDILEADSKQE